MAAFPFGWVLVVFEHRIRTVINRILCKPLGKFIIVASGGFPGRTASRGFAISGKMLEKRVVLLV